MDRYYEKFQKLNFNLSALGFEPVDDFCAYFCTPRNALILGCAGVDGIHYCTIPDFGSMIFAVNPMNCDDYVHPIARNFEDLLRLLLSVTDMAVLEQCHAWDNHQFLEFLAANPATQEQKKVLQTISQEFGLKPMEDAFSYIKSLQSEFDCTRIPYANDDDLELHSTVSDQPIDWKVCFDGGFENNTGDAGSEMKINAVFSWGNQTWHIPSVYLCEQGLVIDYCMEADPKMVQAAMRNHQENSFSENPLVLDFRGHGLWNGQKLAPAHACSMVYLPGNVFPEATCYEPELLQVLKHYQFDTERAWLLHRAAYRWRSALVSEPFSFSLRMEQRPQRVLGTPFPTPSVGSSVSLCHPLLDHIYTLTVQELTWQTLCDGVSNVLLMQYSLSPDDQKHTFSLVDCAPDDTPMQPFNSAEICNAPDFTGAAAVGIIGGADGPTAIVLSGDSPAFHAACSAIHHQTTDTVLWQPVFRIKTWEDYTLSLL